MHDTAFVLFYIAGIVASPIVVMMLGAMLHEAYKLVRNAVVKPTCDSIIAACVYCSVSIALLGAALLVIDRLTPR